MPGISCGLERARRHERLEAFVGVGLLFLGAHGARRHRQGAARLQVGVRDTPDVPELQEDASALGVHGGGRQLPAFDLRGRPDAGRADVALALRADVGRFGDDEAGRGALGVVGGLQLAGDALVVGPRPGQRRHDDAVGELIGPELDRIEKIRLGSKLRCFRPFLHGRLPIWFGSRRSRRRPAGRQAGAAVWHLQKQRGRPGGGLREISAAIAAVVALRRCCFRCRPEANPA